MTGATATVSMRIYFSSYHLWAARHFSELAAQKEAVQVGRPKFDVLHRAHIVNCLPSASAFLEAVINEFFDDASHGHLAYLSEMTESNRQAAANSWNEELERRSTLNKYQFALRATGCAEFDESSAPLHDAKILVEFRNELVHSRTELTTRIQNAKGGCAPGRNDCSLLMH